MFSEMNWTTGRNFHLYTSSRVSILASACSPFNYFRLFKQIFSSCFVVPLSGITVLPKAFLCTLSTYSAILPSFPLQIFFCFSISYCSFRFFFPLCIPFPFYPVMTSLQFICFVATPHPCLKLNIKGSGAGRHRISIVVSVFPNIEDALQMLAVRPLQAIETPWACLRRALHGHSLVFDEDCNNAALPVLSTDSHSAKSKACSERVFHVSSSLNRRTKIPSQEW